MFLLHLAAIALAGKVAAQEAGDKLGALPSFGKAPALGRAPSLNSAAMLDRAPSVRAPSVRAPSVRAPSIAPSKAGTRAWMSSVMPSEPEWVTNNKARCACCGVHAHSTGRQGWQRAVGAYPRVWDAALPEAHRMALGAVGGVHGLDEGMLQPCPVSCGALQPRPVSLVRQHSECGTAAANAQCSNAASVWCGCSVWVDVPAAVCWRVYIKWARKKREHSSDAPSKGAILAANVGEEMI